MPFQVFVLRYQQQEPEAVSGFISAKSAIRLMGSLISGKRYDASVCRVYAVGKRFGWIYSQRELRDQIAMNKQARRQDLRADQNLPNIAI